MAKTCIRNMNLAMRSKKAILDSSNLMRQTAAG
jgi:hypothetical protein